MPWIWFPPESWKLFQSWLLWYSISYSHSPDCWMSKVLKTVLFWTEVFDLHNLECLQWRFNDRVLWKKHTLNTIPCRESKMNSDLQWWQSCSLQSVWHWTQFQSAVENLTLSQKYPAFLTHGVGVLSPFKPFNWAAGCGWIFDEFLVMQVSAMTQTVPKLCPFSLNSRRPYSY